MKLYRLALLLILCGSVGFVSPGAAQERPSDEETNARMQVFAAQRNALADTEVLLRARLAVLEAELKKAKEMACKPAEKK